MDWNIFLDDIQKAYFVHSAVHPLILRRIIDSLQSPPHNNRFFTQSSLQWKIPYRTLPSITDPLWSLPLINTEPSSVIDLTETTPIIFEESSLKLHLVDVLPNLVHHGQHGHVRLASTCRGTKKKVFVGFHGCTIKSRLDPVQWLKSLKGRLGIALNRIVMNIISVNLN